MVEVVAATFLREQAARCRRLEWETTDDQTRRILTELAEEYEARVAEAKGTPRDAVEFGH
jgi:hypothetical protein